ncbi:hypothetical protein B4102_3321 [Heyndrickxia sporothermodurans]|uniref:Uncharacterized protein n=1 Tax=Heyndrickxia sporothermodurans TaxID=46224 RepID=A0A150KVM1_9BACI|nr:hypothetical protein B4102_3321 [Heyndrickxia sporothermodurans]
MHVFSSLSSRTQSLRELQLGFFLLIFSYPILAGTSFGPSSPHLPVSYPCGNFSWAFSSSSSRILSLRELHSGLLLLIFPYLILAGTSVGLSPLHLPESYLCGNFSWAFPPHLLVSYSCGNFIRAFFSSSSRILFLRELHSSFLLLFFPYPIFAGTSFGLSLHLPVGK